VQRVEQAAPGGARQRFEHPIGCHVSIMQVITCLSRGDSYRVSPDSFPSAARSHAGFPACSL
jgi:hypothetical protein